MTGYGIKLATEYSDVNYINISLCILIMVLMIKRLLLIFKI